MNDKTNYFSLTLRLYRNRQDANQQRRLQTLRQKINEKYLIV